MKKWLVTVGLASILPVAAWAEGEVFRSCPATGDGWTEVIRQRNRLQNRSSTPAAADFDPSITLRRILKPGADSGRWSPRQAVELTGYVVGVEVAPPSSANCNRDHPSMVDTRILLTLDDSPRETRPTRRLVAVVTPRWRARLAEQGIDWSPSTLRRALVGQWVRLQGWLYYDVDGQRESENTAPRKPGNWRATAWEVHPVSSLEVVPSPASQLTAEAAAGTMPLPDAVEVAPVP